ncbi:PepSY domain-containing protein [Psychrobacter glacincola]|uniref:PepSY domain-containing protein n=1 Tax=Psychrobacter glacincola TaxID=56810 RepID=UPI0039AFC01D
MKILQPWSFKTALSAGLAITLLGTTVGCAVASQNYDNNSVYKNGNYGNNNFGRISQQLRQNLLSQGYQPMEIKPDNYKGNESITAYAKKNNQPYILKYTYPGLKLISSSKSDWSNVWQDKNHNKNGHNGNYNNNNRYKNDDVEDRIKREARYPAIKQRAVTKVQGMGYRVKDIELEEKNNRGVFEIEAKRGSQEYEILLSYPDLNVIKIEKD